MTATATELPIRTSRHRHRTRVRPVPTLEPQYDAPCDDSCGDATHHRRHLRLMPPLAQPLPFGSTRGTHADSAPPVPVGIRVAANFWSPQPTSRGELADPTSYARRFVQAVMETLAGRRPEGQLQSWLSPSVFGDVRRAVQSVGGRRTGPTPAVRSVRVTEPADGVAEVSAVVRSGGRYRAVAARLEGIDGRWRCVRLEVG